MVLFHEVFGSQDDYKIISVFVIAITILITITIFKTYFALFYLQGYLALVYSGLQVRAGHIGTVCSCSLNKKVQINVYWDPQEHIVWDKYYAKRKQNESKSSMY